MRAEGAPEFPGKRVVTEESFLGDRSDSSSEFVRHRKEQLGSFLRQLFNKNPGETARQEKRGEKRGSARMYASTVRCASCRLSVVVCSTLRSEARSHSVSSRYLKGFGTGVWGWERGGLLNLARFHLVLRWIESCSLKGFRTHAWGWERRGLVFF